MFNLFRKILIHVTVSTYNLKIGLIRVLLLIYCRMMLSSFCECKAFSQFLTMRMSYFVKEYCQSVHTVANMTAMSLKSRDNHLFSSISFHIALFFSFCILLDSRFFCVRISLCNIILSALLKPI